jgi:hypothetical protein
MTAAIGTDETPAAVALAQARDEPPAAGDGVRAGAASLALRLLARGLAGRSESAERRRLAAPGTRRRVPPAAGLAPRALVRMSGLSVSRHTVAAEGGKPIGTVTGVTPAGGLSPVTLEGTSARPNGKKGLDHKLPEGPKPPGQKKEDERKQGKP